MKTSFSQQCHDPITRFKHCLFFAPYQSREIFKLFFISIDWDVTIKTSLWFIIKNRTLWSRTSMDIKAIFHKYEPPDWMFDIIVVRVKFLIYKRCSSPELEKRSMWLLDEFTVVHDLTTLVKDWLTTKRFTDISQLGKLG